MGIYCQNCKRITYSKVRCTHCLAKIEKQKTNIFKKIKKMFRQKKEYATTIKIDTETEKLTIKDIAKHFNKTQKEIIQILIDLKYIEKKGKWIIKTDRGAINGAHQKYNAKTKNKYVIWDQKILKNNELKNKYTQYSKKQNQKTTYKEKEEKGKNYEKYITKIYKQKGYTIWEHGKEKGRKDAGIDLVAKKDNEIILIQCKNWQENGKWKIKDKNIKIFLTDARTFIEDNPIFKTYKLTARYIISGNFIHISAIKYIKEMQKKGKNIEYEIIKIENK